MFKNFLKTTFRNLLKNRSYVVINVIGLSLSLTCCIIGYLNYDYAADFDKNHANHDRIFKVQVQKEVQGQSIPFGITPLPLGPNLEDKIPGVTHVSRFAGSGLILKKDLKIFHKYIGFVDEDFLDMFTFPLKYGSKKALLDPGHILLSEETAEVYFGDADPTGERIMVINDEKQYPMIVGGVLEKIPMNSSLQFQAITLFDNYLRIFDVTNSKWEWFLAGTFFMTDPSTEARLVTEYLNENFIEVQNRARDDWRVAQFYPVQLTHVGEQARDIRSNWLSQPPPVPAVITPFIMAILMLLIACFNFTNTSIAISSKRLKEIGIRKVMGSNRRQLIAQFMGENILLATFSLLIALGLSYFLVPAYSAMWDFIDLELNLSSNPEVYFFLTGLLIFTAVIAGGYPSLFISSYQPVNILRGNLSLGGTNLFSKVLLSAQYTLTVIALISSLAFTNNASYQQKLDVGFEKTNVISVQVESFSEYERYRNAVSQLPGIDLVSGTENHIGRWTYGRTLRNGEQELESDMMDFGLEYARVMDLKLVEGRYFQEDLYEHDKANSILVNETLAEEFGWQDPVGQIVQIDDSTRLTVIGVLRNFHMYGFWNEVEPMAIRPANDEHMRFVVIRSSSPNLKEIYDQLETTWYEVNPDKPFYGQYQDEFIRDSEVVNDNISIMFTFLGLLALILSTIGLFTLVSLNIIKRIKEIGVRKVLGASIPHIILLINKRFLVLLIVAAFLGSVASYFAIDLLMASIFAYYKAVSTWTIALPVTILFLVALGTSSGRILKAAIANPVDSLRYE